MRQSARDGHGGAGNAKPQPPANIILNVRQNGEHEDGANADDEEQPVEEGAPLLVLGRVKLVELVGAMYSEVKKTVDWIAVGPGRRAGSSVVRDSIPKPCLCNTHKHWLLCLLL